MKNHLLEYIEIKDFKCFKDFKAEGFKRVNLIGGKNNVGKTAFMEALFLVSNFRNILKIIKDDFDREVLYFEIIKLLLIIEQNRSPKDFLLEWLKEEFNFIDYTFDIELKEELHLYCTKNLLSPDEFQKQNYWNHGSVDISNFRKNSNYNKSYKKNNSPVLNNYTFITISNSDNETIKNMIDDLKLINKYDFVNSLMKEFFDIDKIDVIKNKVMLQKKGKFQELKNFGDGLKQFFSIVLVLFTSKEKVIFIDELENGIHYLLLDKLWKIILTISKEQNVQIFATTHSKECIESYARVSKKLEDEDISFIELGKTKENKLDSIVYNYDMIQSEIKQNHEIRGW
ncbi:MAG: AAA family ATPase [Arcobacteraceae bacterium]